MYPIFTDIRLWFYVRLPIINALCYPRHCQAMLERGVNESAYSFYQYNVCNLSIYDKKIQICTIMFNFRICFLLLSLTWWQDYSSFLTVTQKIVCPYLVCGSLYVKPCLTWAGNLGTLDTTQNPDVLSNASTPELKIT